MNIEQKLIKSDENQNSNQTWKQLQALIEQAKVDFLITSQEFLAVARGAKGILVKLIEEDCQKRNRMGSLMIEWAKMKEGEEGILFEKRMHHFKDFYYFCIDLLNFVQDLVNSCPKAQKQFNARVKKWAKTKKILPGILKKETHKIDEITFLKYVKEQHLDHFTIEEITKQKIKSFLYEFLTRQACMKQKH